MQTEGLKTVGNITETFLWGATRGFLCGYILIVTAIPLFQNDPFPGIFCALVGMLDGVVHMLIFFKKDYYSIKDILFDQFGTLGLLLTFTLVAHYSSGIDFSRSILHGFFLVTAGLFAVGFVVAIKNLFHNNF